MTLFQQLSKPKELTESLVMASGSGDPPHGKSKVIQKFTAAHYGPLVDYKASPDDKSDYCSSFRGGSYLLTTPSEGGMLLYRRHGGQAPESGQYWTEESRGGNLGYRMDTATLPQWGNDLTKEAILVVPKGIFMFEGYAAPQAPYSSYGRSDGGFLGGGWQIFIPKAVVLNLLEARNAHSSGLPPEKHIQDALRAQNSIMEKYEKEIQERNRQQLEKFCSMENAQQFFTSGNALGALPSSVREALAVSKSGQTGSTSLGPTPEGSHLVHRQTIALCDGSTASVSLHVRLEFSHETTRTYRSGNTIVTETTRHYKRILEWK